MKKRKGYPMKYIWSPWRMEFIQKSSSIEDGCIFCSLLLQADGPENLIVYRGKKSFVLLNRFPYTTGHAMVIPFMHSDSFENLEAQTLTELMQLSNRCMKVLRKLYQPQAFNLGANVGVAAGAGIADHIHMHIVPRWSGDTNFMSIMGETRVLPEDLKDTYKKFIREWKI
ncbi:HIT domain-containing protein [Chloroflexota bacterium]